MQAQYQKELGLIMTFEGLIEAGILADALDDISSKNGSLISKDTRQQALEAMSGNQERATIIGHEADLCLSAIADIGAENLRNMCNPELAGLAALRNVRLATTIINNAMVAVQEARGIIGGLQTE